MHATELCCASIFDFDTIFTYTVLSYSTKSYQEYKSRRFVEIIAIFDNETTGRVRCEYDEINV